MAAETFPIIVMVDPTSALAAANKVGTALGSAGSAGAAAGKAIGDGLTAGAASALSATERVRASIGSIESVSSRAGASISKALSSGFDVAAFAARNFQAATAEASAVTQSLAAAGAKAIEAQASVIDRVMAKTAADVGSAFTAGFGEALASARNFHSQVSALNLSLARTAAQLGSEYKAGLDQVARLPRELADLGGSTIKRASSAPWAASIREQYALSDASDKAKASAEKAGEGLFTMANAAKAFVAVQVASVVTDFADSAINLQNRLSTVTSSAEEAAGLMDRLYDVAQRTRSGFAETAEVFVRTSGAVKEMGLSQAEVLSFTETLSKAVKQSGASAVEANNAMIQLSQGLASGALRGDELRSVLEQLPTVADVIAEHLGVTRGELRKLGSEGKITSRDVVTAFQNASGKIDASFGKTIPTIGDLFTQLKNTLTRFFVDITPLLKPLIDGLGVMFGVLGKIAGVAGDVVGVLSDLAGGVADAFRGSNKELEETHYLLGLVGADLKNMSDEERKTALKGAQTPETKRFETYADAFAAARKRSEEFAKANEAALRSIESIDLALARQRIQNLPKPEFSDLEGQAQRQRDLALVFKASEAEAFKLRTQISQINALLLKPFKPELGPIDPDKDPLEYMKKMLGLIRSARTEVSSLGPLFQFAAEAANAQDNPTTLFEAYTKGLAKTKEVTAKAQAENEKFASSLRSTLDGIYPLEAAERQLGETTDVLIEAVRRKRISWDEALAAIERVTAATLAQREPYEGLIQQLDAENALLERQAAIRTLDGDERERKLRLIEIENDLAGQHIVLSEEEIATLEHKLELGQLIRKDIEDQLAVDQRQADLRASAFAATDAYTARLGLWRQELIDGTAASQSYVDSLLRINDALAAGAISSADAVAQVEKLKAAHDSAAAVPTAVDVRGQKPIDLEQQVGLELFRDSLAETTDAITELVTTGKTSFEDLANSIINSIVRMTVQLALFQALSAGFGVNPGTAGTLVGLGAGLGKAQHGADFRVGGTGGTDSQVVAFRATPGERVVVQTPQQQRAPEGGGGGGGNVQVNNVFDPNDMLDLMDTPAGHRVVMNIIRINAHALRGLSR